MSRRALPGRERRGIVVFIGLVLACAVSLPAFAAATITRVTVTPGPQQTAISLITAEGDPLQVKAFDLSNPPRLVFDLPGARLAPELAGTLQTSSGSVRQVRLGQFSAAPDVARVVVDLSSADSVPKWEVKKGLQRGETLIVLSRPGPVALEPPVVKREAGCVLARLAGAGALKRSVGVLQQPYRVYADVEGAAVAWYEADSEEAPLRAIRMGPQPSEDGQPIARVVVELRQKQAYTMFADGPDLVIAVGPQPWALPLPAYAAAGRLKGRTIVVDPGHGGHDIGAPATFGSPPGEPYEKDIVLDIAQRLARLLQSEGASVTMTRADDTFIALPERAAVANRLGADALVSIHCNSCETPNTLCGTSVYYDHPQSAQFAELVQGELIAALGTADKGVRNANFAVIRRTRGPGILVETAFINNAEDRQRLLHPNFQERTARAIVRGLARYFEERPDPTEGGPSACSASPRPAVEGPPRAKPRGGA